MAVRRVAAIGMGVVLGVGTAAAPASATPAMPSVSAVVVESWGACGSASLIWDKLNADWPSFGRIPVSIDYSNPELCNNKIRLADLEASHADVVILSNPSGGGQRYSALEVHALQTYATEGHEIIGTYLAFKWQHFDNTGLAPLFGLRADAVWTGWDEEIDPAYSFTKRAGSLARGLPAVYRSAGYDRAQRPGDQEWSSNDLAGAKIVGSSADRRAAITLYRAASYDAIYVANMVEFGGGTDDQQFFYNALTYSKHRQASP